MTEWISVKDRVPDQYTRLSYVYGPECGVVSVHGCELYLFWNAERQNWGAVNGMDFQYDFNENITHWMERPKPPEGL